MQHLVDLLTDISFFVIEGYRNFNDKKFIWVMEPQKLYNSLSLTGMCYGFEHFILNKISVVYCCVSLIVSVLRNNINKNSK